MLTTTWAQYGLNNLNLILDSIRDVMLMINDVIKYEKLSKLSKKRLSDTTSSGESVTGHITGPLYDATKVSLWRLNSVLNPTFFIFINLSLWS